MEILTATAPFSSLPQQEMENIAHQMTCLHLEKGGIFARQRHTELEGVYLIVSGSLDLFIMEKDEEKHRRVLGKGDIYGGISILMNNGISVRNVRVAKETDVLMLSKDIFLDLCTRYDTFYRFFVDVYKDRMLDQSYARFVVSGQAYQFLLDVIPFSFLPVEELEKTVDRLTFVHFPKGTTLCVQGQTEVDSLYIIKKGAVERFFEENNQKKLRGVLSEKDIYGGISILINDGVALRSLEVIEDAYCYTLPKTHFLDLCREYETFAEFFTDKFGKRMMDRSYAEILRQSSAPRDDAGRFFSQHVDGIYRKNVLQCEEETPVQEAARIMTRNRSSSVFVKNRSGAYVGIVTDNDLRAKVIASEYDITRPVKEIMSRPLIMIPVHALLSEALLMMMNQNIKHLAVVNAMGDVVGAITNTDLLSAQGQSPFFIIRDIAAARRVKELIEKHDQVPEMIRNMINSGAQAVNVTRLITTISDAILNKLISFALEDMGPPPARFFFMILGSEGRKEQTLKTDQDNAIVYEDVPEEMRKEAEEYFLKFGEKVCTWLDEVGYDFCVGGIMAKNPKWCQPLSVWKEYFRKWIRTAEPEDLRDASIFFDFRSGYGDEALFRELRDHLTASLEGWIGFFRHLAENALHFKPPLGFFRNFVVESKGEHRNQFDIKSAMTPIVDFARLYALQNKIEETNTLERLQKLSQVKILKEKEYSEAEKAYSFLMQLRFIRQVSAIMEENRKPNNYVNPKHLTRIEQTMLKEIFKLVEKFQTKLEFRFTGPF